MEIAERTEVIFGNKTNQVPGSLLAMQMSTIAYCKNKSKTLKHYLPSWNIVWEATKEINGQSAFIANYGNIYVVAIRGSVLDFSWTAYYNWFSQDFNVFSQVHWPYSQSTAASKPKVSQGAMNGLNNLKSLVDVNGETMAQYLLKHTTASSHLLVTGHSLGANLATVFAPYISWEYKNSRIAQPNMCVMTFAAATAGNTDFAQEYDALFPNSYRFYNAIDVVPLGANSIDQAALLYPPPAPSANNIGVTWRGTHVTLAEGFVAVEGLVYLSELNNDNSHYSHTNIHSGSIQLNAAKKIYPVSGTDPAVTWWEQAGQQHATAHYLEFLGGSPVLCQG